MRGMKGRLSIKARVTAWFAVIMFCIATAVFYVMIVHRTSQVKADAKHSLEASVAGFADMAARTGGDFSEFRRPVPRQQQFSPGRPRRRQVHRRQKAPHLCRRRAHGSVFRRRRNPAGANSI